MNPGRLVRSSLASVTELYRRPVRLAALLALAATPVSCATCIENKLPPQAEEQQAFCARYITEGKLEEAEARCKLAIEYAAKYAEPYNSLGLIEYHRGHIERAIEYFKQAISYKTDFAEAHNNLGAIFMERRDYSMAEDQFREALEIDPGFLSARANLGLCLFYEGKPDEARDQFLRCVELDPNICDCRMGMGILAHQKEEWQDARAHFEKLTQICPTDANGWYNLGYTYMRLVRCPEAVDALVTALGINPDYLEARQNLIAAYDCLGKQDGALIKYMDKIRANPGDPDPHFNLGALYEDRKDYARALNEFLNTVKLDEKYAIAHYRAARIYDRNMQTPETIGACQKFVDLLRDDKYASEKAWCVDRVKKLQFGGN